MKMGALEQKRGESRSESPRGSLSQFHLCHDSGVWNWRNFVYRTTSIAEKESSVFVKVAATVAETTDYIFAVCPYIARP